MAICSAHASKTSIRRLPGTQAPAGCQAQTSATLHSPLPKIFVLPGPPCNSKQSSSTKSSAGKHCGYSSHVTTSRKLSPPDIVTCLILITELQGRIGAGQWCLPGNPQWGHAATWCASFPGDRARVQQFWTRVASR